MVKFKIRLANLTVAVSALYDSTRDFCLDYLPDGEPDFSVEVTEADVLLEGKKSDDERKLEGLPPFKYPAEYLETLALYRRITEQLAYRGVILFHGSAIMLDGEAYIFTARSGTGKSTHTRLWREVFGSRAVMVNDDKPLISLVDGVPTVHGTPWCGKHGLGNNISAPIRAVCMLSRATNNEIGKVSYLFALPELLSQTYRFADKDGMQSVLCTLDKVASAIPIFRLGCNMEKEAALVAYNGMKGQS